MSLNETPTANRVHIAFFGRRNAGKSSLLNAVTNQNAAVVSDTPGTTCDPVYKSMELLPIGPVTLIDTPGMDDEGSLGALRMEKTRDVLRKTDIAVLVVDAVRGMGETEEELLSLIQKKSIPCLVVYNKSDLVKTRTAEKDILRVSAENGENISLLKERIAALYKSEDAPLIRDLISPSDTVILVTPIDSAAPKGRLILPQQQTLRDILDGGGVAVVTREDALAKTLQNLKTPPRMVVCDSQVFGFVNKVLPKNMLLTSFSILMARYKGFLDAAVRGAKALCELKDGDRVLISEGCTHHRQCGDIGTVKLPAWLRRYTGKELEFDFSSGASFPDSVNEYKLVIHCGGCMLPPGEMRYRMQKSEESNVPFTNYGVAIAQMNGILARSLEVFPHLHSLLD